VSGDLQQEKKGHQKQEHEEEIEVEGPALPARVLSIAEPPPPPTMDLPGPADNAEGNDLLATIEPAGLPDIAEPGGGNSDTGGGGGGGGGGKDGGGEGGASAPASK
jgi:hypothetical protein